MSGALDGLRTVTMPVFVEDERGEYYTVTNAITWVKRDDVRDLMLSDETVDAIYAATETLWDTDGFGPDDMIRAVLAVLAGGNP
jgi:hypothetical protein